MDFSWNDVVFSIRYTNVASGDDDDDYVSC